MVNAAADGAWESSLYDDSFLKVQTGVNEVFKKCHVHDLSMWSLHKHLGLIQD